MQMTITPKEAAAIREARTTDVSTADSLTLTTLAGTGHPEAIKRLRELAALDAAELRAGTQ